RDDFAKPSGYWPARSDDKIQKGYKGSEYAIAKLAGVAGEQWGPLAAWLADFDAEVDVRLMPPTEGGLVGLEFGPARSTTMYRYEVDPTEGAFALLRWTRPEWRRVIDWTLAPAINTGAAVNRLGVRVRRG